MSVRIAIAAATLLALAATGSAFAQASAPASPSGGPAVQAQGQDDVKPARRARKKGEAKSHREPTVGQIAASERRKKCGAEWREAKAAHKVPEGMKWPKFYSACNARLKGNNV